MAFFSKIVAPDRQPSDNFGASVSVVNNDIIIGAPFANTDINGGNLLSATGSVYTFEYLPSMEAKDISFSNISDIGASITWINGNGSARAVFIKETDNGISIPKENETYIANEIFMQGTQIEATGWYSIYNGIGNNVTVKGLSPNTRYRVMVIEYNNINGTDKYFTTVGLNNPMNFMTLSVTNVNNLQSPEIYIFPNPAGNLITIKYANIKPLKIIVTNLYGMKVIDKAIADEVMDISFLKSGIYIVDIDGFKYKLIKQ